MSKAITNFTPTWYIDTTNVISPDGALYSSLGHTRGGREAWIKLHLIPP